MKAIAVLETIGNALLLQLAFALASVPIVTIAPAAIALQRSVAAARVGERTGFRSFFAEFRAAWRRGWGLGIAVALIGIGFLVGIPFWYSIRSAAGVAGLFVLIGLLGLALGTWLGILAVAVDRRDAPWRVLVRAGFLHLAAHPLRALAGVVTMLAWIVVLSSLPSLLLVASGIAPALIVHLVMRPQAPT